MNVRSDPPPPGPQDRTGTGPNGRRTLRLVSRRNALWLAVLLGVVLGLFVLLGRTPEPRTSGPEAGSVEEVP